MQSFSANAFFHENYISVLCSERRKFSRQRHPCMGNSLARRHHSDMPKLAFETIRPVTFALDLV